MTSTPTIWSVTPPARLPLSTPVTRHPTSLPLSTCWVVEYACSINLTAHRTDFLSFSPSKHMSTVGGVGVVIHGRGTVRPRIPLHDGRSISRDIFVLYTPDLISRSSQGISCLLSVSWLQQQCNCEISFPAGTDLGTLTVPIGM
jgi:hypothetical protein